MKNSISTQSIQTLFAFPFRDQKWGNKLAIGAGLICASFIIPIIPLLFVFGYAFRLTQNIIRNPEDELGLPDWQDWEKLLEDGIKWFGISVIYLIPLALITCLGFFAYLVPMLGMIISENGGGVNLDPTLVGLTLTGGIFIWVIACALSMILILVLGIILPPSLTHAAAKGEFKAAFQFKEWWSIFRANFSGFLIAFVLVSGVSLLSIYVSYALSLTVILIILIPIILSFAGIYITVLSSALFGNAYREGQAKLTLAEES